MTGFIMKYTILIITFSFSFLIAKDNIVLLKVDGMQCSYSCAGKVSSVVQKIEGVKECVVDFDKGIATVVFDDQKLETKDIVDGLSTQTAYKVTEFKKVQNKKEPTQI
jgi:copper chaperone CopZ